MESSKIANRLGILLIVAATAFLVLGCPAAHTAEADKQPGPNSGHSVTLTWHSSAGAKYYCIYRSSVSKSGYQKIGTSPTPSYKDASVPSGTTYYYVVTAVGNKGESKYSGEIKAVVP